MLCGLDDGSSTFFDTASGERLVTVISVGDGADWLAFSPDGRFDGSEAGRKLMTFCAAHESNQLPSEDHGQGNYSPGVG